jgi:hypothetical protein
LSLPFTIAISEYDRLFKGLFKSLCHHMQFLERKKHSIEPKGEIKKHKNYSLTEKMETFKSLMLYQELLEHSPKNIQ